mmetsp:Transcript_27829/g.92509  ORF Transcript_27829/g.92509 Transcript_27829/m.92509 type:complete len:304 (-) Transcript_27829:1736-2647(-)
MPPRRLCRIRARNAAYGCPSRERPTLCSCPGPLPAEQAADATPTVDRRAVCRCRGRNSAIYLPTAASKISAPATRPPSQRARPEFAQAMPTAHPPRIAALHIARPRAQRWTQAPASTIVEQLLLERQTPTADQRAVCRCRGRNSAIQLPTAATKTAAPATRPPLLRARSELAPAKPTAHPPRIEVLHIARPRTQRWTQAPASTIVETVPLEKPTPPADQRAVCRLRCCIIAIGLPTAATKTSAPATRPPSQRALSELAPAIPTAHPPRIAELHIDWPRAQRWTQAPASTVVEQLLLEKPTPTA